MNLVGKIFIVLILVMSVLFMAFALAVYATHRNWYEVVLNQEATTTKPLGLQFQLKNAKEENKQLTEQRDELKKALEKEKNDRRQAVAKVETENADLKAQHDGDQKKLDELTKQLGAAVVAMQTLETDAAGLRKENLTLREQISKAQQERDIAFKQAVERADQLHQAELELKTLRARNRVLADDLANAMAVLRRFGLKSDPAAYTGPPKVEGVVLATLGTGMMEISIGEDDGLMKGHQLEVYRMADGAAKYVGRVEVIQVAPEKAVCRVIPGMLKAPVQVNDRVASKIE
mgnify:CR=1 FL=1